MAQRAARLLPMTEGPFYPPRAWRERWTTTGTPTSRV
jgi:hypothetical protein